MAQYTIGDLAQSTLTRMQSTRLKTEMLKLTEELSTGVVADAGRHLGGDISYYADVENRLRLLDGFDLATSEAAHFADAVQTVLGRVAAITGDAVTRTLPASTTAVQDVRDRAALEAGADLEAIVGALNAGSAGRSLFSGTATDQAALISPGGFLSTLTASLPPVTDAASLIAGIGQWFASPAGYDSSAYRGATNGLAPFQVSPDESVSLTVRADAPELKTAMEGLAIAALATDPAFALDPQEQMIAFDAAADALLASQAGISGLQADVGAAQDRIDTAASRNAASRIGFEQSRAALVGADAYDVATRLEDVQVRLEALYAVTARLSRLTMANFI